MRLPVLMDHAVEINVCAQLCCEPSMEGSGRLMLQEIP